MQCNHSLEEMRIDIPWKNLRSSPVVVNITGPHALATVFRFHLRAAYAVRHTIARPLTLQDQEARYRALGLRAARELGQLCTVLGGDSGRAKSLVGRVLC